LGGFFLHNPVYLSQQQNVSQQKIYNTHKRTTKIVSFWIKSARARFASFQYFTSQASQL